ncbi:hypothetical protein ACJ41O_007572 [Fusarium nematophilum]
MPSRPLNRVDNGKKSMSPEQNHRQLLEAINRDDRTEAASLIGSKYFKWDYRSGDDNVTALHRAVEKGQTEIVEKLAKKYGEVVDACDKYGRTPLHYVSAARPNAWKVTQALLKNGANIDAADSQNLTPLHTVVYFPKWPESEGKDSRSSIAKQLLDNDAEVNTRDIFGDSPLHDAADRGDRDITRQLLDSGADRECRNFNGLTPRDLAHANGHTEVEEELDKGPSSVGDAHATPAIPGEAPKCRDTESNDAAHESSSNSSGNDGANVCEKFFASVRFFSRDEAYSKSWSVSVHELLHEGGGKRIRDMETSFVEDLPSKEGSWVQNKSWKWIHIPVNHMSWVTDLVWCLTEDISAGSLTTKSVGRSGSSVNGDHPESRREAWKFLDRNVAQRKTGNPNVFIRVPHAGDQLKNRTANGQETNQDAEEEPWRESSSESENSARNTNPGANRREIWRDFIEFPSEEKFSLVVPYIDFETEQYLQRYDKVDGSDDYMITTPRIANKRQLEGISRPYKRLIGLHRSQTLDESHYDMLSKQELKQRDESQVVSRWYKERARQAEEMKGQEKSSGARSAKIVPLPERMEEGKMKKSRDLPQILPLKYRTNRRDSRSDTELAEFGHDTQRASKLPKLLMVHQLWLWKLDKDTVITAFPDRYHQGVEDSILETIQQGGIGSYTNPHQLITNIVFKAVTFLREPPYAGLGTHVLDIFASSIANCSHGEVTIFQEFSDSLEEHDRGPDINREINLLYQCKDIRDELGMIRRLFEDQQNVVRMSADVFWPSESAASMKAAFIKDCGLDYLIERTKSLDASAEQASQKVRYYHILSSLTWNPPPTPVDFFRANSPLLTQLGYLVQIKQAQGSLHEAHAASELNKIIWLFTMVTVIFVGYLMLVPRSGVSW